MAQFRSFWARLIRIGPLSRRHRPRTIFVLKSCFQLDFVFYIGRYTSFDSTLALWFDVTAKSLHLPSSWTGSDRLRLFRADLHDEGSFDEAVKGCHGVFHVAASMEFNVHDRDNIGKMPMKITCHPS